MKRLVALAALAASLGACASNPAPADIAGRFYWLSGCWLSADGANRETWSISYGGIMFGYGVTTKDGQAAFFEQTRIDLRPQSATYTASPDGQRPVVFIENRAFQGPVDQKGKPLRSVAFENPEHDYPQRIEYYQPDSRTLAANISLIDGSRKETLNWQRCK